MKQTTGLGMRKVLAAGGAGLLAAAFLAISVGAFGAEARNTEETEQATRVGVLLPLTGPLAEYGERVRKGAELAAERINGGHTSGRVELVVMDSKADPKTGLSVFRQMIDIHGVRYVVGDVSSSVTLSIVPLLQQQGVLLLSPAASSRELSNSSPLFARLWPTDDLEASAVARYAVREGCKKVATVVVNVDYGVGLGATFRRVFSEEHGTVALEEGFPLGNSDYRIIWQKVSRAKPECVYFVGHKPEIIRAMAQFAEAGLRYRIFGNTNFEDEEILKGLGASMEGVVFGTATLDTSSGEAEVKAFVEAFTKKYGQQPSLYAANGYDLVTLSVELGRRFGENVTAAMAELKGRNEIHGAAGNFHILPSGDVQRPIAIKSVRGGKYITLGHY